MFIDNGQGKFMIGKVREEMEKRANPGGPVSMANLSAVEAQAAQDKRLLKRMIDENVAPHAYDPALAGLGEVKATVLEGRWIADAAFMAKTVGIETYLSSLFSKLRERFGGKSLMTAANKHDICPCGSRKKFGKCCGKNVEEGDSEDCQIAGHRYGCWDRLKGDVFIRSCPKCHATQTQAGVLERGCDGEEVAVLPCGTCGATPDEDTAWAIYTLERKRTCLVCRNPFVLKKLLIEHPRDVKHEGTWTLTRLEYAEPVWSAETPKGIIKLHEACLP